ncbi:Diacylglycerol kinase family enzyme [Sphingomonas sp. YR710]|uniref:diacylglycerol/lipid kinase family protein n=1 Tax=Sphingomonas sp. YR710 TaxID=1882773 RepID=UPI0008801A6E|nr:diacylglycerol kinase family protein [Sphingomonas sp. YR710]SDC94775.1 Diacylglycerol kinase family enzyme [Sphingomonas sp. YR710]
MTDSPLPLIVNRAGGAAAAAGDALADTLTAAFAKAGTAIDLHLIEGADIPDTFRRLAGHGRVVVAGGDGTMACAAEAARGTDTEIALLPLGTLNHLARDLGVPAEIDAAAKLAVDGRAVAIDVGDVNGRRFVNNASIGVYPEMVRSRDDTRERTGWPKWLATVPAAWQVLSRLTHHRLHVDMGTGAQPLVTPLLFVGNNHYALDAGEVGRRPSLSDGKLSVYAVAHRSRIGLIWFALRALAGRADRKRDFVAIGDCEALTVWSSGSSIEIALDGELLRLQSPLRFSIEPGALNVVAP